MMARPTLQLLIVVLLLSFVVSEPAYEPLLPGRTGVKLDPETNTVHFFYGDDGMPGHMGHVQRHYIRYPDHDKAWPIGPVNSKSNRVGAQGGHDPAGHHPLMPYNLVLEEKLLNSMDHDGLTTIELQPWPESNKEGGLIRQAKKLLRDARIPEEDGRFHLHANPGWLQRDPLQRIAYEAPARLSSQNQHPPGIAPGMQSDNPLEAFSLNRIHPSAPAGTPGNIVLIRPPLPPALTNKEKAEGRLVTTPRRTGPQPHNFSPGDLSNRHSFLDGDASTPTMWGAPAPNPESHLLQPARPQNSAQGNRPQVLKPLPGHNVARPWHEEPILWSHGMNQGVTSGRPIGKEKADQLREKLKLHLPLTDSKPLLAPTSSAHTFYGGARHTQDELSSPHLRAVQHPDFFHLNDKAPASSDKRYTPRPDFIRPGQLPPPDVAPNPHRKNPRVVQEPTRRSERIAKAAQPKAAVPVENTAEERKKQLGHSSSSQVGGAPASNQFVEGSSRGRLPANPPSPPASPPPSRPPSPQPPSNESSENTRVDKSKGKQRAVTQQRKTIWTPPPRPSSPPVPSDESRERSHVDKGKGKQQDTQKRNQRSTPPSSPHSEGSPSNQYRDRSQHKVGQITSADPQQALASHHDHSRGSSLRHPGQPKVDVLHGQRESQSRPRGVPHRAQIPKSTAPQHPVQKVHHSAGKQVVPKTRVHGIGKVSNHASTRPRLPKHIVKNVVRQSVRKSLGLHGTPKVKAHASAHPRLPKHIVKKSVARQPVRKPLGVHSTLKVNTRPVKTRMLSTVLRSIHKSQKSNPTHAHPKVHPAHPQRHATRTPAHKVAARKPVHKVVSRPAIKVHHPQSKHDARHAKPSPVPRKPVHSAARPQARGRPSISKPQKGHSSPPHGPHKPVRHVTRPHPPAAKKVSQPSTRKVLARPKVPVHAKALAPPKVKVHPKAPARAKVPAHPKPSAHPIKAHPPVPKAHGGAAHAVAVRKAAAAPAKRGKK